MEHLLNRVNSIINTCWESFSAKVGGGLIDVNKEASMQLHFAYLLKNTIDLAIHNTSENIKIELETGIIIKGRLREADIIIKLINGKEELYLPIEMKCYRNVSSSGKNRGAQDLFKFGIYEDLQLLESYALQNNYLLGMQLTMTDSKVFAFPKSKTGKSWDYDTSHGTHIAKGKTIDTPIGGKPTSISLKHNYAFNWTEINGFWFLKIKGS